MRSKRSVQTLEAAAPVCAVAFSAAGDQVSSRPSQQLPTGAKLHTVSRQPYAVLLCVRGRVVESYILQQTNPVWTESSKTMPVTSLRFLHYFQGQSAAGLLQLLLQLLGQLSTCPDAA
jgi:hypothetical protein